MHQDNVIELIELIKSNNLSKLDKIDILEQLCQKYGYEYLITELNNSNIDYSKYLKSIITKCNPYKIDKLVQSLNNNPTIDYSKYLKSIIDKCDPIALDDLVESLNNNPTINYSKYVKSIITKCSSYSIDKLVGSLNNNPTINWSKYLESVITKFSPYKMDKLVELLNNNPSIDYSKYLKSIITKCNPDNMNKLVDLLNNNPNVHYSKYLKSIINKCGPSSMHILVELLNNNPNIDYSKHLKLIINKCNPNILDTLLDLLNKSTVNFKKQLTPALFKKITNIKTLQRITTNVIFDIDTKNLISQVSFLVENIKDSSLSDMDKKKIININKLIKKVYTTKNKKELYKIYNLLSKSQTYYANVINNITEKIVSNFYTKNLDINTNNRKICLNPKIARDIRCGLEIETAGLNKDKVLNLQLNKFSYDSDPSISNYNKRINLKYPSNGYPDTAELVSDIIDPYSEDDISNIYNVCETLKQKGATTNFTCGLHVHVSGNGISKDNPKILDNLLSDMVFMQEIFIKKLNIYSSRVFNHTNLIPSKFSGKSLDFLKYCNKNNWHNKYYMLNLLSLDKYNTLEFRFFNLPDVIDANMILAYADMATSIVNSTRKKGSFCSTIHNTYNLKDIDLNDSKLVDFVYDNFLDFIDVSKKSKKILINMDKIFNFYKAKEPEDISFTGKIIDFHTPKNKVIPTPLNYIDVDENTKDSIYSVDERTLSTSKNSKQVYFYTYKKVDKTDKKQLVKSTKKQVFYPKFIDKEPYCIIV